MMTMMMMMLKAYKIMMVDTAGFGAADPEHADNTKKAGWENVLEPLCLDDGDHHDHGYIFKLRSSKTVDHA